MDQNEQRVQGFLQQVLDYGIRKIYDRQLSIATQRSMERRLNERRNYVSAGEQIISSLRQRLTQLQVQGSTAELISQIPLVMRFVDMKNYGNWQIYNRQVWGMLYREVSIAPTSSSRCACSSAVPSTMPPPRRQPTTPSSPSLPPPPAINPSPSAAVHGRPNNRQRRSRAWLPQ